MPNRFHSAPGLALIAALMAAPLILAAARAGAAEIRHHAYGISSSSLENGLEVLVVENHALPLVTLEVASKNGSFTETPDFNGLSHLYEHMFFKANAAIPSQEKYMERLRELGAQWNGSTAEERVNYHMTVHRKFLREGMQFMSDALRRPLFKEEELRREWPVVLGEFDRNEADPGFHLQREIDRLMWSKYYSRKNVIGDRDVIFKASRAQMREIQSRYYVPNNCAIIVGGDVDPADAVELAQEFFGEWKRAEDPFKKWPVPEHPPLEKTSRVVVTGPVRTAAIQIEWHGPGMKRDTPSTFAADVLSYILGQPDSNFQKALIDSGLADGAGISYQSLVHTGPITLFAQTTPERLDKAWDAIQAELDRLDDPAYVTDEQIESAKRILQAQEIHAREVNSEFCHSLSYWWCTGGLDYYLKYDENLAKVGRDDLVRFARTYIKGKPRVEGALVSAEAAGKIEFAKTAALVQPKSGTSMAALARPAAPAGQVTTEEFDVDGLKVVLRRNPATETVVADMQLLGGLTFYGAANAGRELTLLETLDKGSRGFSKEAVARQLSRTGASLSSEAKQDYSVFGLSTLARDLEPNFAVFADALAHPLLDAEEVKLAVERRLSAIKAQEEEPDSFISVLASRNFFKGHPYEAPPGGTEAAMQGVDAAALAKTRETTFVRERMRLFVVGAADRPTIEKLVREGLKDIPKGEFKWDRPARPAGQPPRLLVEKSDLPTNYILGCFDAPDPASPDYAATQAALSILSDRFFSEVRTKRNLTYAVAAQLSSRHANYGALYVTAVKPNETIQVMFDEIARIAAEPVSEKELRDKIEETVTEDLMRRQSNASQAASLALFEANGGGWAEEAKAVDRLTAVIPAKAQEAARKWLKGFSFAVLGDPTKIDEKLFTSR